MYIHFGNERWNQAAAFALRYDVFVLEQGISLEDEFDSIDASEKKYYVVYEKSTVLATARFQIIDEQTIQPDRLCVKKEYRGTGIGTKLLLEIERCASQDGFSNAVLSAEKTAVNFYQKLGYKINSKEYYEDGIPCVQMKKDFDTELLTF
ncbi:GNAT family N-acetyltransferase [Enterococcus sp. LJL99]